MVLMCVVFNAKQKTSVNDTSDYSSSQLLLSNMGVAAQKINLVGYQVILNAPTGTSVADTSLPSRVFVELDFVGGTQLHVASSPHPDNQNEYEHIHALPLCIGETLNTIQMGLNPISFNVGQRINKHINIRVKVMDSVAGTSTYGKLVPIETDSPALLATKVGNGATAIATLHSIVLYFDYPFVSLF